MATLKDHQQAMVDLLASGSGIPASASRLAHAMHDVVDVLIAAFPNVPLSPDVPQGPKRIDATTPGLNDKALAADVEACRPKDTMFDRARAAERRVKELENTIRQLRGANAKLREQIAASAEAVDLWNRWSAEPEQAGCRKDDTQGYGPRTCVTCGAVTTRNVSTCDDCGEHL